MLERYSYECVADKLTEITKVETMYELIKEAWDRFLYVKGKVTWIGRDRPTPFGSIKMGIMDDEGNELIIQPTRTGQKRLRRT